MNAARDICKAVYAAADGEMLEIPVQGKYTRTLLIKSIRGYWDRQFTSRIHIQRTATGIRVWEERGEKLLQSRAK